MIGKQSEYTRRDVVRAAGGALGAVGLSALALPLRAAIGDLQRTPLGDRISVISGAGSNVVVLETDVGLALVDSGAPEQAEALADFIQSEFRGASVRTLFNTHWHPDGTGANEIFAAQGATIIAHENTRLWMGTEYFVEWERRNYPARPAAALPTETFYSSDPQPLEHVLGGYRIEYGLLGEAHTDGDIYVRFADDNVIAVGGIVAVDAFPVLDYSTGGWIGGNQAALARLLEMADRSTRFVAAEGAPQQRDALQAQNAMLDVVLERFTEAMNKGKGIDELIAENVVAGYENLPNAEQFVRNTYNGLWWGGRVRGPI